MIITAPPSPQCSAQSTQQTPVEGTGKWVVDSLYLLSQPASEPNEKPQPILVMCSREDRAHFLLLFLLSLPLPPVSLPL